MKRLKAFDFVISLLILISAFLLIKKSLLTKGDKVFVEASGNQYEYSLSKDGIYKVEGDLGFTTFEIKDHKVHITDSPCPNKTCINQGFSSPLICLPNRVFIYVQEEGGELDALSE